MPARRCPTTECHGSDRIAPAFGPTSAGRSGPPVPPGATIGTEMVGRGLPGRAGRDTRLVTCKPCEQFARDARGQQGQALGQHRRVRVRPRHRPGVPQARQGGPPARLPRRQGPAAGARGPHRRRPRPASRRCATPSRSTCARRCASTTSTSSPRPRSRSPSGEDDGAGRVRRHLRGPSRDHRPRLRRPARRAAQPGRDRRRGRRGGRRRAEAPRRAQRRRPPGRPAATTSRSTSPPAATARRWPASTPRTGPTRSARAGSPTTSTTSSSAPSAGAELEFTTTPKGTPDPADFGVTVSRVQELVAARPRRRVGRRQPRRVRHGRGVAASRSATASARPS